MASVESTEYEVLNSHTGATADGILVADPSSISVLYQFAFFTHTSHVTQVGHTTGTFLKNALIERYIANSDLISIYYLESIMNFIKTVDNKDS